MAGVDYYDLLGVSSQASPAEIKSAYRRLAKALHPDAGGNSALFRLVTEAYDALSDPDRRRRYDADPAAPAHSPTPTPSRRTPDDAARSDAAGSGAAEPGTAGSDGSASTGSDRSASTGSDGEPAADSGERGERVPTPARPDTSALSWWDQVDPDGAVVWVPRFGLWLRPFLLGAAAWLILLGLLVAPAATRRGGPGPLDVSAIVPLIYVLATTLGWRVPRLLVLAAYLWAAAFGAFGVYTLSDSPLGGCWMLALALGSVLLPRLGQRYLSQRAMDRVFTREFRGFNTFGEPNNGHSGEPNNEHSGEPNNGHSGEPASAPGGASDDAERSTGTELVAGTERTAALLSEYLTRLPGARIFHRLAVPEPVAGELDHAVLCGRRLVLINSAVWAPAHYAIDEFGNVLRKGRMMRSRVPEYPDALESYRTLLPRLEIQGVVLVHPSRSGELVCSAALHAPVAVLTPAGFVQAIGEWLAEAPYTVDRNAFLTVLGQLRN